LGGKKAIIRNRFAVLSFILSIVLVFLSLLLDLGRANSIKFMITLIAIASTPALVMAIINSRRGRYYIPPTTGTYWKDARFWGIVYAIPVLVFTVGPAVLVGGYIYQPDIPRGILLVISSIIALVGAIAYKNPCR
jgi:hypothetical protein